MSSRTVTRRAFRGLTEKEQTRFCDAVQRMMQTGEWQQIASDHENFCRHGTQSFPGWHRIYLIKLENALRRADQQIGGDGNIAVPYWNWVDRSKRDFVPQMIRQRFGQTFFMNSDAQMINTLYRADPIDRQINRAMDEPLHLNFSNHTSSRWSLEGAHDKVHSAMGGVMNTMRSPMNPMFWLHHCNIDRYLEGYLKDEQDSKREYAGNRSGEYRRPLEPFMAGANRPSMPEDTFMPTKNLGYVYDKVPGTGFFSNAMQQEPDMVIFPKVEPMKMDGKCYCMYLFTVPKNKQLDVDMQKGPMGWMESPFYAGQASFFAGGAKTVQKDGKCKNCEEYNIFDVRSDVSDTLVKLELERANCRIMGYAVDQEGKFVSMDTLVQRGHLPQPILTGPFFDPRGKPIVEGDSSAEVEALQKYMKAYGYYDGKIDGQYSAKTKAALLEMQDFLGLKRDAMAGPKTKGLIMESERYDEIEDNEGDMLFYQPGATITYSVDQCPGYLDREKLMADIKTAFDEWGKTGVYKFQLTTKEESDIDLSWSDHSMEETRGLGNGFDGRGGLLAKSDKANVIFDEGERWLLRGAQPKKGRYFVLVVLLHEIGHSLGLSHNKDRNAVMAPFYNHKKMTLHKVDIQALKALAEGKPQQKPKVGQQLPKFRKNKAYIAQPTRPDPNARQSQPNPNPTYAQPQVGNGLQVKTGPLPPRGYSMISSARMSLEQPQPQPTYTQPQPTYTQPQPVSYAQPQSYAQSYQPANAFQEYSEVPEEKDSFAQGSYAQASYAPAQASHASAQAAYGSAQASYAPAQASYAQNGVSYAQGGVSYAQHQPLSGQASGWSLCSSAPIDDYSVNQKAYSQQSGYSENDDTKTVLTENEWMQLQNQGHLSYGGQTFHFSGSQL